MVTDSAGHSALTAQEPPAGLQEAVAAARREAGGLLAGFRHTAGLSQVHLAGRIGYSATVVAHAELGRRPVSAEFWELADGALGAGGHLTARGTRIKDLIRAMHEEQRRLERAGHAGRLAQFLSRPGADDMAAAVPAAGPLPGGSPRSPRRPSADAPTAISRSRWSRWSPRSPPRLKRAPARCRRLEQRLPGPRL
jgi:hypothetical protein